MLGAAAVIVPSLLPRYTAPLITTDAKCLSGYDWMFSSISQSPCDVAAELASVCVGGQFNLSPLDVESVYAGPSTNSANNCRCSSVYYSLLSSCAYCQGRNYLPWSGYSTNCSTVYVTVYNQQIPAGVKVPAYAYQNVSATDTFDVTLARTVVGIESSAAPSNTPTSSLITPTPGSSLNTATGDNRRFIIIGGTIGGLIGLCLVGATLFFLFLRLKRKSRSQGPNSSFQEHPDMKFNSKAPPTISQSPVSPRKARAPTVPSSYTPSMDPYQQHSPPFSIQNLTPNHTGSYA